MKVCIIQPLYPTDFQRADSHDALKTMTKFCAYNTNAYVVRSSVSMGENSPVGGCSMVVAPTGEVLVNMGSQVGMATVDIDWEQVERAIRYDCKKIQLVKRKFDQSMIDRAHENGIICNVFWADDVAEAQEYLDMGIDVILTNDFQTLNQAFPDRHS